MIDECPTGKVPYASKRAARGARKSGNHAQRRTDRAVPVFRCGYCDRYHLGHRR